MRIVLSGGGSGGHITPILAIAHELKTRNHDVIYIGERGSRSPGISEVFSTEYRVLAGKFRRYHGEGFWQRISDVATLALNARDLFKFLIGFAQSFVRLMRIRPDRVFIKGGYVGLPVGLAARALRIPVIIHDSDSVPGLTNRILARFKVHKVSGFELDGWEWVGNPIRAQLLESDGDNDAAEFNLDPQLPTVLVIGGSLGAASVNTVTSELARTYTDYQIIHVVGPESEIQDCGPHYHPYHYLTDALSAAYRLADVVVTRAGANTLSELAAFGKASIIVPHPQLSGNHQYYNARYFSDQSAARLLEQSDLTDETLHDEIMTILQDSQLKTRLERNIHKLWIQDSATQITDHILQYNNNQVQP